MIKKETEKRILQEICNHELTPILEKFNFKFRSSKLIFIRKGKMIDILISVYNLSQPFAVNEKDELIFNYNIRSSFQLTEFDKWYKKLFKKNSDNLTNAKFKAYSFHSEITPDIFKQSDFYEPSAASAFKIKVANLFAGNTIQTVTHHIKDLEKIVSDEIIPEYSKIDSLSSLIEFNRIPIIIKADLLYYSGQHEKSKSLYTDLYNDTIKQLETEDQVYKLSLFSRSLAEIETKYEILFKDKINPNITKTMVEVSIIRKDDIIINQHIFKYIGTFTKIIPPVNYYTTLAKDHKRGIDFTHDSILISHQQNILSKWDLNLSLTEESEYEHTNEKFNADILNLIPNDSYESATSESKDGNYVFVGGYNTKSYLIDTRTKNKKVLWAHETFKDGYKEDFRVSHNFGVNQAKFILNDEYILACACHAKNVIWDTKNYERKELTLPFEYTFKGAPPSTEFANDVKQICNMNSLNLFGLLIREDVLIFDKSFEVVDKIKNVKQIHFNELNKTLILIRIDNNIDVYTRITKGNKS